MRHIRYTNNKQQSKDKKEVEIEEENKKPTGFFGSMSKTTKYILLGLLIGVIILIIYLIYRSSRVPSSTDIKNIESNIKGINTITKSSSTSFVEKDLDIVSNASYSELVANNDNLSETGTIDDIIIEGPQTGMPIGNLRYVYF
jgi:cell division protein FtsL